jgi:hypothetical protein
MHSSGQDLAILLKYIKLSCFCPGSNQQHTKPVSINNAKILKVSAQFKAWSQFSVQFLDSSSSFVQINCGSYSPAQSITSLLAALRILTADVEFHLGTIQLVLLLESLRKSRTSRMRLFYIAQSRMAKFEM